MKTPMVTDKSEFLKSSPRTSSSINIVFQSSTSKNFEVVFQIAKSLESFSQIEWEGSLAFGVKINLSLPDEAAKACVILSKALPWKGTLVFSNSATLSPDQAYKALETIKCFLTSAQCDDWRAHCFSTDVDTDRLFDSSTPLIGLTLMVPCRKIAGFYGAMEGKTGVSIADRVQAVAVRDQCHICPRFNKSLTRIISDD